MSPALEFRQGAAGFGSRTLWSGLDLVVQRGEFVAVLGANGSGKTTLLRTVIGSQPLRAGSVLVDGRSAREARHRIGYVPQHRTLQHAADSRGSDLVALGVDGHRFGPPWPSAARRRAVREALAAADVSPELAGRRVGNLSGGEAQRVRVAQAVAGDPALLLCDEPLASLDVRRQRDVAEAVDRRRREAGTAVLFVTHEINPVLPYVDRVLYLGPRGHRIGTVDDVMTSGSLSELYGTPVEVIRRGDRLFVAGTDVAPAPDPVAS
ncbi:metal ABC transporter ATP-binding protein [Jatrophihabitans sp. YIM 134969]